MTTPAHRQITTASILALLMLLLPASALSQQTTPTAQTRPTAVENKLHPIAANRVCMVNNSAFEEDQIPVKVGEKTYYGCCKMCEKTLNTDSASRVAVDPVSGKQIDKAAAVLGANGHGEVFYFENQANFEKYRIPTEASGVAQGNTEKDAG